MKRFLFIALSFLAFTSQPGFAGSKTVVDYGVVQQSQIITSQARNQPLRTLPPARLAGPSATSLVTGAGKRR